AAQEDSAAGTSLNGFPGAARRASIHFSVDAHAWYRGLGFGALVFALASVVVLLAASAATPAPATQTNVVTQARARLAKLAVPRDAIGKPKSTPKWKRGMKIWVISCDQSLTGCWIPAKSLQ